MAAPARALPSLLGAMAAVGLAVVLVRSVPPGPEESLWLRWLRTLAAHPGRSGLAVFLLIWACRAPPQPSSNLPEGLARDRDGRASGLE